MATTLVELTQEEEEELFAPEITLPNGLVALFRERTNLTNEKVLLLAVLEDGIHCFEGCPRSERPNPDRLRRDAERWIGSEDESWLFSFNNVCYLLGLEPSAVRNALLKWKARRSADNATASRNARVFHPHLRPTL